MRHTIRETSPSVAAIQDACWQVQSKWTTEERQQRRFGPVADAHRELVQLLTGMPHSWQAAEFSQVSSLLQFEVPGGVVPSLPWTDLGHLPPRPAALERLVLRGRPAIR